MPKLTNICFCILFLRLIVKSGCDGIRNITAENCKIQKMNGSPSYVLICAINEQNINEADILIPSVTNGKIFGKKRFVRGTNPKGAPKRFSSKVDCVCSCFDGHSRKINNTQDVSR